MSTAIDSARLDARVAPAPLSGWRRAISDTLLVSGAAGVGHALGVITSLVLRAALGPARIGIWQGVKLALSYANYANLGVSKGATRELTIALGRGDDQDARTGLNLAFTFNLLTSLACAIALGVAAVWLAVRGEGAWTGAWAIGLGVAGVLVVLQRHVSFHVTVLRCRQEFASTSRLAVLEALLGLVVAGTAAWLWGLPGLYLGTLATFLIAWWYVRRAGAQKLQLAWNASETGRLMAVGFPILASGVLATLFRTLDKLMILAFVADREYQLGCYSIALLVSGQIYGLGNMFATPMPPRYGELFGRTQDRGAVARLAARAGELQALILSLLGGLSIVASGPLVETLLPEYRAGLTATLWLVPGTVALGLALPASQYLVAVRRERAGLAIVAGGVVFVAILVGLALSFDLAIEGVAFGASLAYLAYFLASAGAMWSDLDRDERWRFLATQVLLPSAILAWSAGLCHFIPNARTEAWVALAIAMAVILPWTAVALAGWRLGGWSSLWNASARER